MIVSQKRKLIEIVEVHPDLWRPTKKDANLKQKLWNDVGAQLDTSGFDARRQWEILRDQFRREYKRSTYDKAYTSKWIFYNRMLFVRKALRTMGTYAYQSNSDNDDRDSDEQKSIRDTDISQGVEEKRRNTPANKGNLPKIQVRQDLQESTDSSHSKATFNAEPEAEPSTSAGVSSSCQRSRYDEVKYSPSVRRKRKWHTEREDIEDEDYHFVMSILPSLRSIQHTKKLRIRSKIMEVIARELDAENRRHMAMYTETESDDDDKFLPVVLPIEMQ